MAVLIYSTKAVLKIMTDLMLLTRDLHEQVFDHYLKEEFLVNQMERLESSGELDGSVEIYGSSGKRVPENIIS